MSKETGGAAFPGGGVLIPEQAGMTLRDYFAGQALNGIIPRGGIGVDGTTIIEAHEAAYLVADAMITERNKHE